MFRSQVSFDSTLPKFRLQCTVLLVEFLTWPLEKLQLPVTPLIWYRVWNILMSWVRNTRRLGSWRLLQAGGMQLCMSSIVVNQKGQFWMTFRSSSYATMDSGHRQSRPCQFSEWLFTLPGFEGTFVMWNVMLGWFAHSHPQGSTKEGSVSSWWGSIANKTEKSRIKVSNKQGQQGSCDRSDINAKLVHSHVFTRLHAFLTAESTCCTPQRPIGL